MAEPVTTLRAWRFPARTRHLATGGLFVTAVLTAVVGQQLMSGFASLATLMLSATLLGGAIVYLMLDFQGTMTTTTLLLLLPGGRDVPLRRIGSARAEGHDLVLDLVAPDELVRIPTQQPVELVEGFAQSVLAARGSED